MQLPSICVIWLLTGFACKSAGLYFDTPGELIPDFYASSENLAVNSPSTRNAEDIRENLQYAGETEHQISRDFITGDPIFSTNESNVPDNLMFHSIPVTDGTTYDNTYPEQNHQPTIDMNSCPMCTIPNLKFIPANYPTFQITSDRYSNPPSEKLNPNIDRAKSEKNDDNSFILIDSMVGNDQYGLNANTHPSYPEYIDDSEFAPFEVMLPSNMYYEDEQTDMNLSSRFDDMNFVAVDAMLPNGEYHSNDGFDSEIILSDVTRKVVQLPSKVVDLPPKVAELPPNVIKLPSKAANQPPKVTGLTFKFANQPPKVAQLQSKVAKIPPKVAMPSKFTNRPPKVAKIPPTVAEVPPKVAKIPSKVAMPSKFTNRPPKVATIPPTIVALPPKVAKMPPTVAEVPPKVAKVPLKLAKIPSKAVQNCHFAEKQKCPQNVSPEIEERLQYLAASLSQASYDVAARYRSVANAYILTGTPNMPGDMAVARDVGEPDAEIIHTDSDEITENNKPFPNCESICDILSKFTLSPSM